MKIRQGFVSNSSSASFIVTWKPYEGNEHLDIDESLNIVFYDIYNQENKKELCERIKIKTVQGADKTFKTSFHTNMYNNMRDFGETASCFVMELIGSESFTLVNAKVDDD